MIPRYGYACLPVASVELNEALAARCIVLLDPRLEDLRLPVRHGAVELIGHAQYDRYVP
jgi:hypothetical protein